MTQRTTDPKHGPSFSGVEIQTLIRPDQPEQLAFCLGSSASGTPSIAEDYIATLTEPPTQEEAAEHIKGLVEVLSGWLQIASDGDGRLYDAARFYEVTAASWFLSALTGVPDGGAVAMTTFRASAVDMACLQWLADQNSLSKGEMIRRLVRGMFAQLHIDALHSLAAELWTNEVAAEFLEMAEEKNPPVWARLMKQMVAETEMALEQKMMPGGLIRALIWKAENDIDGWPQGPMPITASPEVLKAIREKAVDRAKEVG